MEKERVIKVPATGVFDFESIVTNERAKYVDKTDLLYRLCNDADQQLFISRPRRFGKSLMLSTLKAMFEGRRDLFKGLAIDKLPWEGWGYADKWIGGARPVTLIGVNFNPKKRNIDMPVVEPA